MYASVHIHTCNINIKIITYRRVSKNGISLVQILLLVLRVSLRIVGILQVELQQCIIAKIDND